MKQVDELIRGELAAVKSIDSILNKIKDSNEKTQLTQIRQDHILAVDRLKMYAKSDFVEDAGTSGPWGAFASAFTGGASLFGDKAAMQALKIGEQHGLNEYKESISDAAVSPELRHVIESELIPNQQKHLDVIDQYLQ
jgi:hypothetical protein